MWNPDERGGIAWPTLGVFDANGRETYRMRSRDFADRPTDEDLVAAVQSLALPPIALDPAPPGAEPEEDGAAFRADALGGFFRGIRSGVTGLATRLQTDADQTEARAMAQMASSFLDAWRDRRATGN